MTVTRTIAISIVLLGGSIWVGSMVCLAVVARVATRVLSTTDRVELFADVGSNVLALTDAWLTMSSADIATRSIPIVR